MIHTRVVFKQENSPSTYPLTTQIQHPALDSRTRRVVRIFCLSQTSIPHYRFPDIWRTGLWGSLTIPTSQSRPSATVAAGACERWTPELIRSLPDPLLVASYRPIQALRRVRKLSKVLSVTFATTCGESIRCAPLPSTILKHTAIEHFLNLIPWMWYACSLLTYVDFSHSFSKPSGRCSSFKVILFSSRIRIVTTNILFQGQVFVF
jgi:hypothetical protein